MDLMITNTNSKGQVVIPANLRKSFGITPDVPIQFVPAGNGIMIFPVSSVVRRGDMSESHINQVLNETRGIFASDKNWDIREKKIRKAEIRAAKLLKKAW